jgi:pimeloyl-ACP methyl ester carboxylesterase
MRAVVIARRPVLIACLLLAGCAPGASAHRPPGTQEDLTFTRTTPLARDEELARRALTPLTYEAIRQRMGATGIGLRESAVDLSKERFSVYVPGGAAPPRGWGLIVYVAPWPEPTRPRRWRPPLDRHALVFVSAERSGNESGILDRRLPLALLAHENVRARLPIDPERVYVAGFSGGGKVALAAALAYPDVFRGALLDAGSERIDGSAGIYVPPADLFRRFQRSRVVYATGEHDELNVRSDRDSRASLEERCVLDVEVQVARRLGHEPLDPAALDRALDALDRRRRLDGGALDRCNDRLAREVSSALARAEDAIRRGDRERATALLKDVDARYGGLAAPPILELEARRRAMP